MCASENLPDSTDCRNVDSRCEKIKSIAIYIIFTVDSFLFISFKTRVFIAVFELRKQNLYIKCNCEGKTQKEGISDNRVQIVLQVTINQKWEECIVR